MSLPLVPYSYGHVVACHVGITFLLGSVVCVAVKNFSQGVGFFHEVACGVIRERCRAGIGMDAPDESAEVVVVVGG